MNNVSNLVIVSIALTFAAVPTDASANMSELYGNTLRCVGARLKGSEDWGAWSNFYVSKKRRIFSTAGIYQFSKRKRTKQKGPLTGSVLEAGKITRTRNVDNKAIFTSRISSKIDATGFSYKINTSIRNWAFYNYKPANTTHKGQVYKNGGKWILITVVTQRVRGGNVFVPYQKSRYSCTIRRGRHL